MPMYSMIWRKPKTKTGEIIEDTVIAYDGLKSHYFRWTVNGKVTRIVKLAKILGYRDKIELQNAVMQYGYPLIIREGFDYCRNNKTLKSKLSTVQR